MVKAMSMNDELNPEWHIIGNTVRGASHNRTNAPNQDHILWSNHVNFASILAISDGHGGEKYFRSNKGSQYAVEVAIAELGSFAEQFSSEEDAARIKRKANELPDRLVKQWKARVNADVKENLRQNRIFTEEEWQRFNNGKSLPDMSDPLIPYGATLLAVLVARTFILCLQLGDGDIVFFKEDGEPTRPIESDARLLANETTSLCMPSAAQDFRQKFYRLQSVPPALIMVSTDGYANSFITQEGFLKVGADILEMLRTDGIENVEKSVKDWLTAATNQGSGDDITLGLLCRLSALKPLSSQVEEDQHVLEEQKSAIPAEPLREDQLRISSESKKRPDSFYADQTAILDPSMLPPIKQGQQATSLRDFEIVARPPDQRSNRKHEVGPRQFLMVSQRGGDDFTTISEALEQAGPTKKIFVKEGKYKEALKIDKDVELIALGDVTIEYEVPCIVITAQTAHMRGFNIRGTVNAPQVKRAAVEIRAGSSQLEKCDISSRSQYGVYISGAKTSPHLKECKVHNCQSIGIVFNHEARGTLGNCTITLNELTGVKLEDRSSSYLFACIISGNVSGGFHILHSKLILQKCKILANGGYGLVLVEKADGELRDCEVEGSSYGVNVDDSKATIHGGSITSKGQNPALSFSQVNTAEVEGCKIASQATAVIVENDTSLSLRKCSIRSETCLLDIKHRSKAFVDNKRYLDSAGVFCDETSIIKLL